MARKKKAPVVRNIINDTPNTYRVINRMNGIVTMIEYTGEDDIKAYELEPTYQEIGGGGGGIDNPVLSINVVATGVSGDIGALPLLQINDNVLQSVSQMVSGGTTTVYSTVVLAYDQEGESVYVWDGTTAYPSMTGATATLTVSNEVNCTVNLNIDAGQFYAMITDPTQPASFTLTIS